MEQEHRRFCVTIFEGKVLDAALLSKEYPVRSYQ